MQNQVILFDGDCNLCNGFIQFIIKIDRKKIFRFSSLQSEYGRKINKTYNLNNFDSIILLREGNIFIYSDAIIEILKTNDGFWNIVGKILSFFPQRFRNWGYKLFARYRISLLGKNNSCLLPTQELKSRFL